MSLLSFIQLSFAQNAVYGTVPDIFPKDDKTHPYFCFSIFKAFGSNRFTNSPCLLINAPVNAENSTDVSIFISVSFILDSFKAYLNISNGMPPLLPAKTVFPFKSLILNLFFKSHGPTIN